MGFPWETFVAVCRSIRYNSINSLKLIVRGLVNTEIDKILQFLRKMSMLSRTLINLYELIMELLSKPLCECVSWVCMNPIYIFPMVIATVESTSGKVKLEKNNYQN